MKHEAIINIDESEYVIFSSLRQNARNYYDSILVIRCQYHKSS